MAIDLATEDRVDAEPALCRSEGKRRGVVGPAFSIILGYDYLKGLSWHDWLLTGNTFWKALGMEIACYSKIVLYFIVVKCIYRRRSCALRTVHTVFSKTQTLCWAGRGEAYSIGTWGYWLSSLSSSTSSSPDGTHQLTPPFHHYAHMTSRWRIKIGRMFCVSMRSVFFFHKRGVNGSIVCVVTGKGGGLGYCNSEHFGYMLSS